jgi:hypothetical protein
MKYFKDNAGKLYAYAADGSEDSWIKPGLTQITDIEARVIQQQSPTPDEIISEAKQRLKEIDRASIRAIREWLIKRQDAPQVLKEHEAEAVLERAKVVP